MNKIQELRNKRHDVWNKAKAFLEEKRDKDGFVSAEDTETYERMEQDVVNFGKEIERLERQRDMDMKLVEATSRPEVSNPMSGQEEKTGTASNEYKRDFWNAMRSKTPRPSNALQVGTDSEGGYLVPDEFEGTLVEALEEENILRSLATVIKTSSGDRKIPIVASKGTASWISEESAIPESDVSFGQISIGAHKLGTMIKVSGELLSDSAFDIESYIAKEFGRRLGSAEEEAFLRGGRRIDVCLISLLLLVLGKTTMNFTHLW
jgi:HK97 family phage major capsid protein